MPTISIRGNEMPASPIRKLAPLADAAKQRGVHVFHLNIGQPDLPTPQAAIDAIRNIDRKVLEYSPSAGNRSYREKLVGYYAKFNINLTADDIIITSGGSEAVLFSFLSCLNPGDEIIVPEPAYANYMAFAISAGAKIRTIATTIEEGFSLPKVEKFEELINERTKAILICNPNNPTGSVLPHDEMKRLAAQHPDVLFVIDQSYEDFTPRMLFSPHEAGALSNVILLHSLTKRFGIPGLRVGYLTARQEWTARIRQNKMPWSVNTLALEAALFLTEHEKDFRIDLQALLEERVRVAGQLEALRIAEVWPGETHFLLARLRMGKASALKDYLAETHGMLIRDAGNFEGLDERYFRIAVQSPEEDDRLLAAIGEWMFSI